MADTSTRRRRKNLLPNREANSLEAIEREVQQIVGPAGEVLLREDLIPIPARAANATHRAIEGVIVSVSTDLPPANFDEQFRRIIIDSVNEYIPPHAWSIRYRQACGRDFCLLHEADQPFFNAMLHRRIRPSSPGDHLKVLQEEISEVLRGKEPAINAQQRIGNLLNDFRTSGYIANEVLLGINIEIAAIRNRLFPVPSGSLYSTGPRTECQEKLSCTEELLFRFGELLDASCDRSRDHNESIRSLLASIGPCSPKNCAEDREGRVFSIDRLAELIRDDIPAKTRPRMRVQFIA